MFLARGSRARRACGEWSRDQLASSGLANSRLEPWGPFGRGWELRRFSAQVTAPHAIPLIAYPKAWSPSVGRQPLETDVVHVDIKKPEHFERYRGKLRGKIVLDGDIQELKLRFEPLATRRNETNLLTLANAGEGPVSTSRPTTTPPNPLASAEQRAAIALLPQKYQFFSEEGAAVLLQPSRQGDAGTLFTSAATVYPPRSNTKLSAAGAKTKQADAKSKSGEKKKGPAPTAPIRNVSPWKTDAPPIVPQITVAAEHYNRLVRMTQLGEKLRIAVDLQGPSIWWGCRDFSSFRTISNTERGRITPTWTSTTGWSRTT